MKIIDILESLDVGDKAKIDFTLEKGNKEGRSKNPVRFHGKECQILDIYSDHMQDRKMARVKIGSEEAEVKLSSLEKI